MENLGGEAACFIDFLDKAWDDQPVNDASVIPESLRNSLPLATVLLRHELPDGSWHVDWMFAQDRAAEDRLITFRLPRRLDELAAGESIQAERLEDHRAAYLEYQGPVSGGRGSVSRLRSGQIVQMRHRTGLLELKRQPAWIVRVRWSPPLEHNRSESAAIEQEIELRHDKTGGWTAICVRIGQSLCQNR